MANSVEKWRLTITFIARGTGILLVFPLLYFVFRVYNSFQLTHTMYTNPDLDPKTLTNVDWMDEEDEMDNDTAEVLLYFQNLLLELMKYRMVVTSWHLTVLLGVWTIPQIQAAIWLIKATFKNLKSAKKEGKLMLKWGRMQVVYLIAELVLIAGQRYYSNMVRDQGKVDNIEDTGEFQAVVNELEKHGKILIVILISRMTLLVAVLNYERIKVINAPKPLIVHPIVTTTTVE